MPKVSKLPRAFESREIIYPKRGAVLYCVDPKAVEPGFPWGGGPITGEVAAELMGFISDPEQALELGLGDPLFKDAHGNPTWATNNPRNRPLYMKGDKSVESCLQEIFNRRWHYNSEPIIRGKTGTILNGQHGLSAVYLAWQHWTKEDSAGGLDWKKRWPEGAPHIEKLVTYGVEETDEVVNTMDTCKPRSLMDVIYRNEFFTKKSKSDQKTLARVLEHAMRFVWSRAGGGLSAFATYRTPSESIDFIERHRKLLKAVNHVFTEYRKKDPGFSVNARRIGPGYAAGLLYLMGLGKADGVKYHEAVRKAQASDRNLDASLWEKAEEFWVLFATGSPILDGVFEGIGIMGAATVGHGGSTSAKVCLIAKAWDLFLQGKKITYDKIKPEVILDRRLMMFSLGEWPVFGGIDLGDPNRPKLNDPSPEELEQRIKEERERQDMEKLDAAPKPKAKGKGPKKAKVEAEEPGDDEDVGHDEPAHEQEEEYEQQPVSGNTVGGYKRKKHDLPPIHFGQDD